MNCPFPPAPTNEPLWTWIFGNPTAMSGEQCRTHNQQNAIRLYEVSGLGPSVRDITQDGEIQP